MTKEDKLHRAIQVGLLSEVRKLVKEGADMDHVLGMRGTALCAAIETRSPEIAQFLIVSGCDVNAQDFDGEPPLLLAIRKQSPGQMCGKSPCLDIVKLLVNNPNCNLNKVDPLTKKSAIHFATEQNMADVVDWLITSNSNTECDVNHVDANGNTPLHLAVLQALTGVVEVLVNHPKCLIKIYNKAGLTPLHICARNGDMINMTQLVKRLSGGSKSLKEKVMLEIEPNLLEDSELDLNINAVTLFEKETCLHISSRLGHIDVVELLLENGAKVDVEDNLGNTPLLVTLTSTPHWQTRDNSIPQLLLKKGANPNVKSSNLRCRYVEHNQELTPLHLACKSNNVALVKLLIECGADVNMADNMNQTPLYIALWENAISVALFLLHECANINLNTQTDEGNTCLHALVKCRSDSNSDNVRQIVKTVIQKGGQIYANYSNKTVLHKAFEYEDYVLFDAVMEELGCTFEDVKILGAKDDADNVPDIQRWIHKAACSEGFVDLMRVLLSHGADIDTPYYDYDNSQLLSNVFIALFNEEYKMVKFLVNNGADLRNEKYLFLESVKKSDENTRQNENIGMVKDDDDDDDDDDDEDDDFSDSSDDDIFHGNDELRQWLQMVACTPTSLKLSCLVFIRKYFIQRKIPFQKMCLLKLPVKLTNELRYKVS